MPYMYVRTHSKRTSTTLWISTANVLLRVRDACKRCNRYLPGTRDQGISILPRLRRDLLQHGYAYLSTPKHHGACFTEFGLEVLKSMCTFAAYFRSFLEELGYSCPPAQSFEDIAAALLLDWWTILAAGERIRHFAAIYQYVKSLINKHTITLAYVPTL
jgi:hypothetical protein